MAQLTKLNIPGKIHVGCVKRGDTYTGKLAYVIYTDEKGKVRKEKSWNGWRDKKIPVQNLDNEPTEGFVLNKKIGGQNWGWHSRQTKVRVYDPREFEFEIDVENLLFILEECSAIKGKGLEGEFVYAWDGPKLLLLPISSQEYKASKQHTENQSKKVTAKDMVEGCIYRTKKGFEVMYLGRHAWHYQTKGYKNFPLSAEVIEKNKKLIEKKQAEEKKRYGYVWHNYRVEKTESRYVTEDHKWKADFKLRVAVIQYEKKKKQLAVAEKKLKTLMSEGTKTELELDDLAQLLA